MLTFDEAAHEYKLDGHTLPSVTHICRYLSVDIDKSRPWLRDMAANRGTRVHAYCEIIDYDGPEGLRVEPDCIGYVQAYLAFRRDYRIKGWLAVERPIASASLGVAGTPDRIGYVDNVMTIVDLKTTHKAAKDLLAAQLNGYRAILAAPDANYRAPEPIAQMLGLQLRKNGTYRVIPVPESSIFQTMHCIEKERMLLNAK